MVHDVNDYTNIEAKLHSDVSSLSSVAKKNGAVCTWLMLAGDSNMRGVLSAVGGAVTTKMGYIQESVIPSVCVYHDASCAWADRDFFYSSPKGLACFIVSFRFMVSDSDIDRVANFTSLVFKGVGVRMDTKAHPALPDLLWVSQGLWSAETRRDSPKCSSNCSANRIADVVPRISALDKTGVPLVWQTNFPITFHPGGINNDCLLTEARCQVQSARVHGIEVFDAWAMVSAGLLRDSGSYHLDGPSFDVVANTILGRLVQQTHNHNT